MFSGNYVAAFAIKAIQPKTPLWLLFLAVQLADIAWAVLVLVGIEHGHLGPALIPYPLVLDDVPYTHSLVGTAAWALLVFALARWKLGNTAMAAGLASAVLSHFFVDLVVHRPDLTWAGGSHKIGLGLWNSPYQTVILGLGLLAATLWWCLAKTNAPDESRKPWWRAYTLFAVMQFVLIASHTPPSFDGAAAAVLLLCLAIAGIAWRLEQLCPLRPLVMGELHPHEEPDHAPLRDGATHNLAGGTV